MDVQMYIVVLIFPALLWNNCLQNNTVVLIVFQHPKGMDVFCVYLFNALMKCMCARNIVVLIAACAITKWWFPEKHSCFDCFKHPYEIVISKGQ